MDVYSELHPFLFFWIFLSSLSENYLSLLYESRKYQIVIRQEKKKKT